VPFGGCVPVRQWVLSLPHRLRYLLAWDHDLCRAVSGVAIRAVLGFLRRRARAEGVGDGRSSAVVVVQRFGGALNLNIHLHAPVLAAVAAASVEGRVAMGPRAGGRVRRCGDPPEDVAPTTLGPCHARADGFDLHAGLVVRAGHRDRLERVCRYALRPPLAQERLHRTSDGEIWLTLRRRWADGTTHLRFDPLPTDVPASRPARARLRAPCLARRSLARRPRIRRRVVRAPRPAGRGVGTVRCLAFPPIISPCDLLPARPRSRSTAVSSALSKEEGAAQSPRRSIPLTAKPV
jgi:hypothetical protein